MTDHRREMLDRIADYLDWCYSEYVSKVVKERHVTPSQNEFSKWLGIPPTSMSAFRNKMRLITIDACDRIALHYGPEIYDLREVRRAVPDDPMLRYVGDWCLTLRLQ